MILFRILAIVPLMCLVAFGAVFAAVCICAHLPRRPAPADCLIVLGARIRPDGSLSATLQQRCDAAYDAWKQGIAPKMILCGGKCSCDPAPEAPFMADYLRQKGVPDADMLIEQDSVNTVQNLQNAETIMEHRGFRSAAIITSDFHLTRAMWIANTMRLRSSGIAARSPGGMGTRIKLRFRETISWLLYFIYGINTKG